MHGKIFGDPRPLRALLDRFEREHPGIRVKAETLPSSTDEQHQFYVTNLEGQSSAFDLFSLDVIWVAEFARAGWLNGLNHLFPPEERAQFFPGSIDAAQFQGGIYAIPWYIDAGLLYYRKDLLGKYGFSPPKTWLELVKIAQTIMAKEQEMYGFLFQGKQYEGLVCNAFEYMRSRGGKVLEGGKAAIDSIENREALEFMRALIAEYRVSPSLVTTAVEETTRNIFGNGKAIFMRNWPYAWHLFQKEGCSVKGKVEISSLPSFPGGESAPTLGGWQLGINRYSRNPKEAEKLLTFLTSTTSQKTLALALGYHPTRTTVYQDQELLRQQPFLARLAEEFMKARPRPVTPYYMMLTQVMQPEFSAVLTGIRSPSEALRSARRQMDYILGLER